MLDRPTAPTPGDRKPRLAIVSTFDDLCGIAGYTRFLVKQLEEHFDIEVFDLEQFFMRSHQKRVRLIADRMVKDFCARAGEFDFVNIQLEHGTLGTTGKDITRRFEWIARAARGLSVTFHTILPQQQFPVGELWGKLRRFRLSEALALTTDYKGNRFMAGRMYKLLRELQTKKPVNIIVHTRRDMRLMRYVNGFESVYDHPLAFIGPEQAQAFRNAVSLDKVAGLAPLPAGAKIVGIFGFLSQYKGFDTVIRAMHLLPDDHHLLIFGGLHPNEIKKNQTIAPYVQTLLREARIGVTVFDELDEHPRPTKAVAVQLDAANVQLLTDHPKNITGRLHFLGPQTDEDFARNMALCDHVVLPYVEVGQSSSGVLSIALEMGSRVLAARNHAFVQFTRYHPNSIELFEIGNHVELAERIMAPPAYPPETRPHRYDTASNTAIYVAANSAAAPRQAGTVRRSEPATA